MAEVLTPVAGLSPGPARSGDRIAIAAYLGKGDVFDRAICDFAEAYADQNERDYKEFGRPSREAAWRQWRTVGRGPDTRSSWPP